MSSRLRGKKMEKWLRFQRYGDPIPNSPFVAFKVPLDKEINRVPVRDRFTFSDVFNIYPNIGLVIDLTATTRYYDPQVVLRYGSLYKKISIQGHGSLPNQTAIQTFNRQVDQFLRYNPGKLIGVHCTHGVNRTGYLICQYMMSRFNMSANTAINYFRVGRHHSIERQNYIEALYKYEEELNRPRRNQTNYRQTEYQPSVYQQQTGYQQVGYYQTNSRYRRDNRRSYNPSYFPN